MQGYKHTRTHTVQSVCVMVRLMGGVPGWKVVVNRSLQPEDTATKLHLHNTELICAWVYRHEMRSCFLSLPLQENLRCIDVESYLFKKIDFLPSFQPVAGFHFISECRENKFALALDWWFITGNISLHFVLSNLCFRGISHFQAVGTVVHSWTQSCSLAASKHLFIQMCCFLRYKSCQWAVWKVEDVLVSLNCIINKQI